MKQKTDLKTLILAAKADKKFIAYGPKKGIAFEPDDIKNNDVWHEDSILNDWEVEWIEEPLKFEQIIEVKEFDVYGQASIVLPKHYSGRRFKLNLVEIQEGEL